MKIESNSKVTFINGFILKILALLFMTIDHIGWAMREFLGAGYPLVEPFRFIGRFALPLFCFMIAEGVMHTKSFGKYALRLGIMATAISIAIAFVEYVDWFGGLSLRNQGNIFLDLLLGAVAIYCLSHKKTWVKLLAILPIGWSILCFWATCQEWGNYQLFINICPFFLRMQYHWYSMLMIILCWLAYKAKDLCLQIHEKNTGILADSLKGTNIERYLVNIFSFVAVMVSSLLLYASALIMAPKYIFWDYIHQNAAIIAGAFLLFYNGKRGYNAKWFQYGSYLYYPVHLLLIFGIFILIYA